MSFWGIEEDYEAQAEAAAAGMDVPSSNDEEYVESVTEDDRLRQMASQLTDPGAVAYEKTAEAAAVSKIKTDNTVMFIVLGVAALGLFFLLKKK